MTSYQELLAQRAALEKKTQELEKAISSAKRAERAGVIGQIKSLMSEHGLTVDDLGGKSAGRPAKEKSTGTSRKVAPKYRNAATGESWTGRGLKPKWLQSALAAGKKLEDFTI